MFKLFQMLIPIIRNINPNTRPVTNPYKAYFPADAAIIGLTFLSDKYIINPTNGIRNENTLARVFHTDCNTENTDFRMARVPYMD